MTVSRTTAWGATQAEWTHFADTLGLREDLLPVVSNPAARISPLSKMKALGKTPSTFNRDGDVVGVPSWTQHTATEREVQRWKAHSDLGICIQTRRVRAIDIDVEDGVEAQRVRDVIELVLEDHGINLPMRWREGSGKCLLAFTMEGQFTKRIIRTSHGLIEFLANGQQFVAIGTHPKGERYQWQDGDSSAATLPNTIPTLTPARFEELWAALAEHFALSQEIVKTGLRPITVRDAAHAHDDVIDYLEAAGSVKSWEKDGRLNVSCPWENEHTTDSGDTATQWLPAGVGGFDQGHFKCLHAHCASRGRDEFLEAIGFTESQFEVMDPVAMAAAGETVERPAPVFQRKRSGAIVGNIVNVRRALERPDYALRHIAWDEFRAEIVLADWTDGTEADVHTAQWRAFTDNDYTDLKLHLEGVKGFEVVAKENMRDAVRWVAQQHKFDSAIEWLEHRVPAWDGKKRIEHFFSTYMGAADVPYARGVALYTWTAMAGRVLSPGCKADMVPVLISEEGTGKSTGVATMVPAPEHYLEVDLSHRDDNLARAMRGKLVGELGELRGLQTRDEESIRAWVTRQHEEWTPKYQEFATRFARRCIFIGTANNETFLPNDGSAARRWLPLQVGRTQFDALAADRDQLWAEARDAFAKSGVAWQVVSELAKDVRDDHRVVDDWQQAIEAWLLAAGDFDDPKAPSRGWFPVTTTDVLTAAIGLPLARIARKDQERAANVLKALGYVRKKPRVPNAQKTAWAYCPTSACKFLQARANTLQDVSDLA